MTKTVKIAVGVGVAFLVLLIAIPLSFYVIGQGITSDGNKREAALSAAYKDNQNYLSDCIIRIRESANITTANTSAIDKVLSDAVSGRYDQGSSAGGAIGGGAFFSAMHEQYPNISQVGDAFSKMLTIANGCRADFRDKQSGTLDQLRSFDSWKTGSYKVRSFGGGNFPDGNLVARFDNKTLTGKDAEEKMYQLVVVSTTNQDFNSGTVAPENPFATPTAKP